MRKTILILLTTSLFMSSCSKEVDTQPDIPPPDTPCFAEAGNDYIISMVEIPNSREVGDGKYDAIGNGYDVTLDYAISSGTRFPVIDTDRLAEEHPEYIKVEYPSEGTEYYYSNYSSNAYEYMGKLSKQQKETNNTPVFVMALDNFSNIYVGPKWYGIFDGGFVCATYELIVPKKSVAIEAPISVLVNYTRSSFQDGIQKQTPEQLVNTYGTHVVASIHIGGRMRLKYVSKTFNSDREYAAKAGIKSYSDNVKGLLPIEGVDVNVISKNYWSMRAFTTSGSKNSIIGNGGLDADYWKSGVENGSICDFWGDNALIPIYEFITDHVKKAEVKSYVEQYIQQRKAKLEHIAEYLYCFYSNKYRCNYYNMCSETPEDYISTGPYHTGKVFSYKAPNTVPVYYFYSKADHYYSTNPSAPQGYTIKGIYFYAYPKQEQGTVPVYKYLSNECHSYSTEKNGNSEGIAWYAVPSL